MARKGWKVTGFDVSRVGLRKAAEQAAAAHEVAWVMGSRAVLTHASDEAAKELYQRYQFDPSPLNEFHLGLS
ncbi:MAG: hypothetical protein K2X35_05345 [Bryobacteraceae bacterium]|nr:hypothetical protein [Bryobacteraceae bacterium]